jgi:23S rRNA pseudouridine1911/1915/1917 synthase
MQDELNIENQAILDNSDELYERFSIIIDRGQEPLRIDKFLMQRIEGATRNKLQQSMNLGMVTVNGKEVKPNYKVKPSDAIVIFSDMSPDQTDVVPEKMDLNIIYEDTDLMIINKPPGMVVHPGSGNYTGTLLNGVSYYLQQQNPTVSEELLPRFGLVHRIDKNTSGLLVLAKNDKAMRHLAKQFFGEMWKKITVQSSPMWAAISVSENYLKLTPKAIMAKKPLHITGYWNALGM